MALNTTLQEELSKLEPWDKNVEFQRKKCGPSLNAHGSSHLVVLTNNFQPAETVCRTLDLQSICKGVEGRRAQPMDPYLIRIHHRLQAAHRQP